MLPEEFVLRRGQMFRAVASLLDEGKAFLSYSTYTCFSRRSIRAAGQRQ
jgi:hypothetical protein